MLPISSRLFAPPESGLFTDTALKDALLADVPPAYVEMLTALWDKPREGWVIRGVKPDYQEPVAVHVLKVVVATERVATFLGYDVQFAKEKSLVLITLLTAILLLKKNTVENMKLFRAGVLFTA